MNKPTVCEPTLKPGELEEIQRELDKAEPQVTQVNDSILNIKPVI